MVQVAAAVEHDRLDARPLAGLGHGLADRAKKAGYESVVFDRAGYLYHGRVKALADGAREGGLKF